MWGTILLVVILEFGVCIFWFLVGAWQGARNAAKRIDLIDEERRTKRGRV